MKRLFIFILLVSLLSGCAMMAKSKLPTVLTSREQQWTIPAGTEFTAIQKPKHSTLTKFAADEDLMVLHKGTYLELEQEANSRAIKQARAAKTQGALWGSLGSILAIIASLLGKNLWKNVTGQNKKK